VSETVKFTLPTGPKREWCLHRICRTQRISEKTWRAWNDWRDANGIGFGNLSIRDGATSRFYITGSGTGGIADLIPSDYARVVAYDFAKNWLRCEGPTVASSESLTHAAVYESEPTVFSVIHGHDVKLWAALLEEEATATPKGVEYGTPEMAYAVRNLFKVTDVKRRKIFAMAGHEGGVAAFGRDVGEAFGVLSRAKGSPRRVRPAANREQPSGD
jgi:ribulose-5-phosphate 4-epimerase/fuculose-1-phosphate aldolase